MTTTSFLKNKDDFYFRKGGIVLKTNEIFFKVFLFGFGKKTNENSFTSIFTCFLRKKQMKIFLQVFLLGFWEKNKWKFFLKYFHLVMRNNQKIKLDVPSGLP